MNIQNIFKNLKPVDALFIIFSQILSILGCIFFPGTITNVSILIINIAVTVLILFLSKISVSNRFKIARFIHDWYPVPGIFFIFKEVHYTIMATGGKEWDRFLINIDRAIFNVDPTVWLSQFSTPLITEILQMAYTSYYFIMLAVAIELYRRKELNKFNFFAFTIVYGFVLSYLGYLMFPGVGPRFTLHNFALLDSELPGLWLTPYLRDFINAGESIPKSVINPIAYAQRDIFPSGHTQMTLLTMYYAHRYKLSIRYIIDLLGVLLIIGTVYLRYHYVIDIIGGFIFAAVTIWTAKRLILWWEMKFNA
ncbi:MAG: phosphatase PAP2 family protein [Ignavibacteriales bacterium]|nr:phosphatase PAP2 family protein [Ignavibacteriales bacterium]